MSLLHNTSWSAVAGITTTLGRMGIVVLLARRLGPASFGLFVFVQWIIEMASLVCSGGLPGTATRFFPHTAAAGSDAMPGLGRWFLRRSIIAVALTGLVATGSTVLFTDLAATDFATVAFWAASYTASALSGARALGQFRFKRFAASSALSVVVVIVGLNLPIAGHELGAAMLSVGAGSFAAAAACGFGFTRAGRGTRSESLAGVDAQLIRSYATNAWLTSIAASFVWSRGEISVVKAQLTESAVGFYSVGLTLAGIVNQGVGLLTGGLWPQIASGWDRGDRDGVLRISSMVTGVLMIAAGLSSGFVICFGTYLIRLLFGEAFRESSTVALILALGPLALVAGSANLVLQAATHGRFGRNVTVSGGLALFAGAFVLVPRFGMAGAAVARSATQIAVAIATFVWIGKVIGHSPGTRQNLRSFLCVVALAIVLVVVLTVNPTLHVGSRLALFGVYSCLLCLGGAPLRDLHTLRRLRGAVARRYRSTTTLAALHSRQF